MRTELLAVEQLLLMPAEIESQSPLPAMAIQLPGETGTPSAATTTKPDMSVRLDPPASLATGQQQGLVLEKLIDAEGLMQPVLVAVPDVGALILGQLAGDISDAELDIRLTEMLSQLGARQTELNLQQVRQLTEQNRQQMALNAQKMEEVAQRHQDAGTAGVFAKVFGWAAAIVSIVVGTVMVATGLGAVAGALMIAGGVMGVVSMSLNQAAEDGHISKEVMKYLGPMLMAVEVALALASVVLTCGGSLVVVAARVAGKASGKVAQTVQSVVQNIQNVVSIGGTTLSCTGEVASSIMQGLALRSEAQLAEMRLLLDQGHSFLEQLAKALEQLLAGKEQRFEQLLELLNNRSKACADIACRNVIA
ncbi:type III secretion system translocon subunit SctE [Pseudomonas sp. BW16M2]|uniref:type III secretion system translocon subunit SctE n=1 Tax=Pseudomonas sp. BW16M2 TaxID=2745489 RepID=UPI001644E420|nr:type III secretion system translocon subunit SctE [Pseudomonas sp. BW16M2]MBC3437483.1 type III secretion system translocon subunit SctE [Pseudomonas sp. BW16M2]